MSGSNLINSSGNYGTKCNISSSNSPKARFENRAVWNDAYGNFLMYGGFCYGEGALNDLWVFCTSQNQWIWLSNDSISTTSCNWGTIGISNPFNKPAARWGALGWTSSSGELYLFGGHAAFAFGSGNDLWKFKIDSACYCPNTLSINENSENIDFILAPNPTSKNISIKTSQFFENGLIQLYDSKGKMIDSKVYHGNNILMEAKYSKGIYFVMLIWDNNYTCKKIIIE
jgi:hypothetical protein